MNNKIEITHKGVNFNGVVPTMQDLRELKRMSFQATSQAQWVLADYLEAIYKGNGNRIDIEEYGQELGYAPTSLRNIRLTAHHVEYERRRLDVSFGVTMIIVQFTKNKAKQDDLLRLASRQKYTCRQMRAHLSPHLAEKLERTPRVQAFVDYLYKREKAVKKFAKMVDDMDINETSRVMGALEPFVKLQQKLEARSLFLVNAANGALDNELQNLTRNARRNPKPQSHHD